MLIVVIVILYIDLKFYSLIYGVLISDDIDYARLNDKIKKCYVVNCYISFGEKLNVLTRSVSHHALALYTEHNKYIVSRIKNVVQIIEIIEEGEGYVIGSDNYKYYILESFSLLGLTVSDVVKYGQTVCQKHTYSLLNHNCQEFVYDIMRHYGVISKNDVNRYEGKTNLFLKGVSEVMNKK